MYCNGGDTNDAANYMHRNGGNRWDVRPWVRRQGTYKGTDWTLGLWSAPPQGGEFGQ